MGTTEAIVLVIIGCALIIAGLGMIFAWERQPERITISAATARFAASDVGSPIEGDMMPHGSVIESVLSPTIIVVRVPR